MNDIQIFEHSKFGKVRSIIIDNEPWFVGKDVAICLNYRNPQKAIRDHVDLEDKTVNETFTVNGTKAVIINESGVYSLILGSKKPEAREFKRWITSEVLPSIRKYGVYATAQTIEKLIYDPSYMVRIFTMLRDEQQKNKKLTVENVILSEKCKYLDMITSSTEDIPVTLIAKDYGMSAQEFNTILHYLGIQYRLNCGTWVLYSKYAGYGYTRSKTFVYDKVKNGTSIHTYWTQKGRKFLYETLRRYNIYPLCERRDSK